MRRREREEQAAREREDELRRLQDRAYWAGVEAGRRRCGDDLRALALTYSHSIPRHVIVMTADRWRPRGSDEEGGGEDRVQVERAQ